MPSVDREAELHRQLQTDLQKHARLNDYNAVIGILQTTRFLSAVPLDTIPVTAGGDVVKSAELEVSSEHVMLNGIHFYGSRTSSGSKLTSASSQTKTSGGAAVSSVGSVTTASTAATDDVPPQARKSTSSTLHCLWMLCDRLCANPAVTVDAGVVYDSTLKRMSRKVSGADSYFKLNSLLGSADLMLLPIKSEPDASQRQKEQQPIKPTEVDLFVEGNNVHCSVSSTTRYGLFRKGDVTADLVSIGSFSTSSSGGGGSRPWIVIDAVVMERSNYSSGQSVRYLKTRVVDRKAGQ